MIEKEINGVSSIYCKYQDKEALWECDISRTYITLEGEKIETVLKRVDNIMFHRNTIKETRSTNLGFIDIITNIGTSCKIMKGEEGFSLLSCKLKFK